MLIKAFEHADEEQLTRLNAWWMLLHSTRRRKLLR